MRCHLLLLRQTKCCPSPMCRLERNGHHLLTSFCPVRRRQLCEAGSIMPWATKDKRKSGPEDQPSDPQALFCPELSYDWTDLEHLEAAGSLSHLDTSALSGTKSPAVRSPLRYILPEDEPSSHALSKNPVRALPQSAPLATQHHDHDHDPVDALCTKRRGLAQHGL